MSPVLFKTNTNLPLFYIYEMMKFWFNVLIIINLLAISTSTSFARMTSEDYKWIILTIEKGEYDIFEYKVDSTVILGANQYRMDFGTTTMIHAGDVDHKVEVLNYNINFNSPLREGEIYFIMAKKQKYRYKTGGQFDNTSLFTCRVDTNNINSTYEMIKQYCSYKKLDYTGTIDLKVDRERRSTGFMKKGKLHGVWFHEYYGVRRYIQYKNNVVQDTSYEYVITHSGWQLYNKTLERDSIVEYWSYGYKNRKIRQGELVLKSYSRRTKKQPSTTTKIKFHETGFVASSMKSIEYNNTSNWNNRIRYLHEEYILKYSNGCDSIIGQYQYGHKVDTWKYYNKNGSLDSVSNHQYKFTSDTIHYINDNGKYGIYSGKFCLKDGSLEGNVTKYHDDFQISRSTFKKGQIEGKSYGYSRFGSTRTENYFNGKLHGTQISQHPSGALISSINYRHGTLHGLSKKYEGGFLNRQELYKDGYLVSLKEWNSKGELITDLVYDRGLPTGRKAGKHGGYATLVNGVYVWKK